MSTTIDQRGTHLTHCCALHGCKYGEDAECPVTLGAQQEHPCEFCRDAPLLESLIRDLVAELAFVKNFKSS